MSNIQDGNYRARAVEWSFGQGKTGTPYMAVRFKLADSDETIVWYGYLSEKTKARTMESLRTCGWNNDDVTEPLGVDDNEVEIVVEAEEYNGKWTPKVKWVNRPGAGGLKVDTVDDKAKRAFAAQMKADAIASRSGMPKPAVKKETAPAGNPHGEDLPPF